MELELWQLELKYAALKIGAAHRQARVVAALCEHGQQQPVLVVASGAADRYVLIDGYARVAALAELKRDTVQATVLAPPRRTRWCWRSASSATACVRRSKRAGSCASSCVVPCRAEEKL